MKTPLVLIGFVLVSISYQQEPIPTSNLEFWTQMVAPHVTECIAESGVDPVLADKMIRYKEFPNDRALGCYIKCFAGPTRLYTINSQGELLVENVMKLIGAPSGLDIIDHCKKLQGLDLDPCETALAYGRCTFEILVQWKESQA